MKNYKIQFIMTNNKVKMKNNKLKLKNRMKIHYSIKQVHGELNIKKQ